MSLYKHLLFVQIAVTASIGGIIVAVLVVVFLLLFKKKVINKSIGVESKARKTKGKEAAIEEATAIHNRNNEEEVEIYHGCTTHNTIEHHLFLSHQVNSEGRRCPLSKTVWLKKFINQLFIN